MTSEKAETRRRYSAAMKAQVVAACGEPGASVAKVAMAHGINCWRRPKTEPVFGRRQHAFDRKTREFRDFVITRIKRPVVLMGVSVISRPS